MSQIFNIYCDESCHLEHDRQPIMILGAVWSPQVKTREIATRLHEIKMRHNLSPTFELKWGKVSKGKENYYQEVLDYFFENPDLHFRALVADKTRLRHEAFGQDHDTWYYKMYFVLLQVLFSPEGRYRIYLDQKDTRGGQKVEKLHEVLCHNVYDFDLEIIERVQIVASHEVEQVQLCDFLSGIVGYAVRELKGNSAKLALVQRMRKRSGYSLTRSTLLTESKANIFRWQPDEVIG
ncbi:MAG: DUF3800 domain-containing protein [Acidobacteriia bacterium]|nr:DUF3800 domain-containing protein [Terriglobia bacterium]